MILSTRNADELWEDFRREVEEELDQSRKALREVKLMLEQSQAELTKLTQRNASITSRLQQVHSQFDTIPRPEIREAYNAALDAQQRLLVMRGQIEKLQSDELGMQKLIEYLEKIQRLLTSEGPKSGKPGSIGGMETLEMVINAQESVRQRLSTQMHDGPAQALSNFMIRVDIASRLLDMDPVKAKEELSNLQAEAKKTFVSIKSFISELRPMMLDDLGLFPTIRKYVEGFKEQTGFDVNLNIKGQERRLESYLEVMVFRAIQELMGNAARHNQDHPGRLQLGIQVVIDDNYLKVAVSDNGKGFNPDEAQKTSGLGLKLIRERVEMLGGTFDIDSAVGQGSKISFSVPCIEPQSPRIPA